MEKASETEKRLKRLGFKRATKFVRESGKRHKVPARIDGRVCLCLSGWRVLCYSNKYPWFTVQRMAKADVAEWFVDIPEQVQPKALAGFVSLLIKGQA